MRLYEINTAIQLILLDAGDDGEIGDDIAQQLDLLQLERKVKVDNICRVIRHREARAAALKVEADRLATARRVEENAVDWLKRYIYASLTAFGERKMETELFRVRIQANSAPSVKLDIDLDEATLPDEFRRVVVEADKAALAKAAKEGRELPAGVTVETGSHLRIS